MLRELMRYLDASFCAEIAIVLFFGVFLAVSIRTLLGSRQASAAHAAIPLSEGRERTRS